jgi:hypothetical protein
MLYRRIIGLPPGREYEVDASGRVRNTKTKHIVKPTLTNSGYYQVVLGSKVDNKVVRRYIHRLVARAFIGDCTGLDINHRNGNKTDNRIGNLEICTRSENLLHAYKFLGLKVHNIRLTKEQANKIRKEVLSGRTQRSVAKEYKVSFMVVSRIIRNIQTCYL